MPRLRHGVPAQHAHQRRQSNRTATDVEPVQKKRRLIQIGSSPPPFTTASHLLATRDPRSQHDRAESTSPKATRNKRIVLIQRNNRLDLRSSGHASPHCVESTRSVSAAPVPAAPQRDAVSSVDQTSRRGLLQRNPQLDWSVTSSPIGTFGGQALGRSGRGLCSSHTETSDRASRVQGTRTVGLPSLNRPSRIRVGLGGRGANAQISETTEAHNENAEAPLQQAHRGPSKRPAEEGLVKPKRRRAKIQRIQLGGGLPSSSAEQPLSDADHHLNSQPDADVNAADESEISYFPTLRPARPSSDAMRTDSDESKEHAIAVLQGGTEEPTSRGGPTMSIAIHASDPQDVTFERADAQPEDGDSSAGLLEVLSQSAMRKLDAVQGAQSSSIRHTQQIVDDAPVASVHFPPEAEAQHQVQVDFDPSHLTHTQAQHIAASIVTSKVESKRWSAVHPDSDTARKLLFKPDSKGMLLAAFRPPSTGAVCRDLGLSSSQMRKRPFADVPDFVHHGSAACDKGLYSDVEGSLESFEHDLCFAGYRQTCKSQVHAQTKTTELASLRPFKEAAFQQRRQTRRKEVVKVIIPFSEPSLSAHATRARFVAPNPATNVSRHRPHTHARDDAIVLSWMQSTAHSFFHALKTMIQAGFAPAAHNKSSSHCLDPLESDLYPCPILHYAAHADTSQSVEQGKAPSHVALYVHLDRLEEARQKLATIELGGGTDDSYRPFSDPGVRLLVTSLPGEPLCLI
ncbi:uncharacterized protein SRS1_13670 [Sporisorium reilianum f. sp. reilianum]|uniref:Uncharacterized protein n=1 Tax=Sporisorium reilianum f. sp. reilianum TaxID=72559 RepID=A0A2N8UDL5_9BASI|nr:uncharacterized protein SRS1_13670 [Sporisorium reilianum f. sp. reilianum]